MVSLLLLVLPSGSSELGTLGRGVGGSTCRRRSVTVGGGLLEASRHSPPFTEVPSVHRGARATEAASYHRAPPTTRGGRRPTPRLGPLYIGNLLAGLGLLLQQ
jgi:hypothetical protein